MKKPIAKSLFIVLFASMLIGACSKDNSETPQTKESLKGKVKVITEYVYSGTDNNGVIQKNSLRYRMVKKYNEYGKITESQSFDTGGPGYKETYTYNEKGKLTEYNMSENQTYKYIYDEKGNPLETDFYFQNQPESIEVYKTDNSGSIIETSCYTGGHLEWKIDHSYDSNGNVTETHKYFLYGSLNGDTERITFRYDTLGNITEETCYNSDGLVVYSFTYNYIDFDKIGNWINRHKFISSATPDFIDHHLSSITEREIEYYQ
jgi:YD repeat-containing protein